MKKIYTAFIALLAMPLVQAADMGENEKQAQLSKLAGQWSPISQCALFPKAGMASVRDHHEFHLTDKDGQLGEEIIRRKRNIREELAPADTGVLSIEKFDITSVNGKSYFVLKQLVRIPRADGEVIPVASISYLDYQEHYIQKLFQEIDGRLVIQYGKLLDFKGNVGQKDPQKLYKCDHPKTRDAIALWEADQQKDGEEKRLRQVADFRKHAAQFTSQGEAVATDSKFKYTIKTAKDELSKKDILIVENETAVGAGSVVTELTCGVMDSKKIIKAQMTFYDVKLPVQVSGKEGAPFSKTRKNDQLIENGITVTQSSFFNNVHTATLGLAKEGNLVWQSDYKEIKNNRYIDELDVVYDLALKLTTDLGDFYLEIPPYNKNIRKLIAACSQ
jgi:hypothetical protein